MASTANPSTWGPLAAMAIVYMPVAVNMGLAFAVKRHISKQERRSPLRGKLHHVAGQQLLDRLKQIEEGISDAFLYLFVVVPFLVFVWIASFIDWTRVRPGVTAILIVLIAIALSAWALRKFKIQLEARQRARDGLAAERMTAQQLNRLIGPECIVLHDVPGEGFNLDHVVIAPRAVYAIETKSFRKPAETRSGETFKVAYDGDKLTFPDWSTSEPITQARRQAHWLSKFLRDALDMDIPVIPAVSLPGWWIDQGKNAASSDVRVFTPMGRGANFMSGYPQVLPPAQRSLIAQALALRYPDAGD